MEGDAKARRGKATKIFEGDERIRKQLASLPVPQIFAAAPVAPRLQGATPHSSAPMVTVDEHRRVLIAQANTNEARKAQLTDEARQLTLQLGKEKARVRVLEGRTQTCDHLKLERKQLRAEVNELRASRDRLRFASDNQYRADQAQISQLKRQVDAVLPRLPPLYRRRCPLVCVVWVHACGGWIW